MKKIQHIQPKKREFVPLPLATTCILVGFMAVIQPEGQLTWGGAVLPQIETLSPRIRKALGEGSYVVHGLGLGWWVVIAPEATLNTRGQEKERG